MGHTFTNLLYHYVFSTKQRVRSVVEEVRERLYQYMGGITRNTFGTLLRINGVEDHVHMLVKLKPRIAVSDFIGLVKGNSSKWASDALPRMELFQWQGGFSCFTVSESLWRAVARYIDRQPEHHRRMTYEEELRILLERNGVPFDPENYLD